MFKLKSIIPALLLLVLSCSSGGPLTPAESFKKIKNAVEKNDSEGIAECLTVTGMEKISKLKLLIKDMNRDQLVMLSGKYGYPVEKLQNLKVSEAVALYFFSDVAGVKLGKYFKENIVSIDVRGSKAAVKTESGVELDFVREGPYWKFDLSNL